MYIVLVEHQNAGKRYVFDCTALSDVVRLGDTVICETIRGKQTGKAVTNPIRVESNEGSLASLFKLCGAYLPIKRIVGIERQRELTEAEKERIAMEWLREELEQKQQEIEQYKQFERKYNEFIKSWEKYQQDKEKMIEGLRWYGDRETYDGNVEWDDSGKTD